MHTLTSNNCREQKSYCNPFNPQLTASTEVIKQHMPDHFEGKFTQKYTNSILSFTWNDLRE